MGFPRESSNLSGVVVFFLFFFFVFLLPTTRGAASALAIHGESLPPPVLPNAAALFSPQPLALFALFSPRSRDAAERSRANPCRSGPGREVTRLDPRRLRWMLCHSIGFEMGDQETEVEVLTRSLNDAEPISGGIPYAIGEGGFGVVYLGDLQNGTGFCKEAFSIKRHFSYTEFFLSAKGRS
ncbi:hypothetical protein U9M48_001565 [Paspalum notatum var. saurae]|uniref:Protein kinase domain-containing protein n=1 Tax=Paspalum notatum var. saurae TaxID=547442 RepID=A0AAQ3SJ35_PASNO